MFKSPVIYSSKFSNVQYYNLNISMLKYFMLTPMKYYVNSSSHSLKYKKFDIFYCINFLF